ncbi:Hint domain-containing protein [Paracoccus endophyticus]|uniref:Hint domain-containing protein n=1 Tax=Paracoccus endophyticus TaxID=2233774 RepID=UPI0013A6A2E0|nr:Hint domain-containing protein [Paracoccus endophyticus]
MAHNGFSDHDTSGDATHDPSPSDADPQPGVQPLAVPQVVEGTADGDLIDAAYLGDPEGDRVDGADNASGTDDDVIQGLDGDDTINAGAGDDTVYAGAGADSVQGGGGNDVLRGFGDTLDGSDAGGNDTLFGDAGDDTLLGGGGDDSLNGGHGADVLVGGDGNDVLHAGAGDSAQGGEGRDGFVVAAGQSGTGTATVSGGETGNDFDVLDGYDLPNPASLTFTGAEAGTLASGTMTVAFTEIETVVTSESGDTVDGSAATGGFSVSTVGGNDTITGSVHRDTINAGSQDDLIRAGAGNDAIDAGSGADTVTGGTGNDSILLGVTGAGQGDGAADLVVLETGSGADTLSGFEGATTSGGVASSTDRLDVGGLTDADGNPVNVDDVSQTLVDTDSDGRFDDVVLTFGGGESVTLRGVGRDAPYTNAELFAMGVPCFAAGTLIRTERGEVRVEDLVPGDRVVTADNGPQPVRWVGVRRLDAGVLDQHPALRPVRIRRGALGAGLPAADLVVSPQHRVLVRSAIAQRMFGAPEVLVAAKQLLQIDGIDLDDAADVTYVHFLCDRHEVVFSNGAPTESLYTGPEALKSVGAAAREEILVLFPQLRDRDPADLPASARPLLSGRMARKLAVRHAQHGKPLVR